MLRTYVHIRKGGQLLRCRSLSMMKFPRISALKLWRPSVFYCRAMRSCCKRECASVLVSVWLGMSGQMHSRKGERDGESEVSAHQAACQRGHDRACRSWQNDADVGDDAGVGQKGPGAVYSV